MNSEFESPQRRHYGVGMTTRPDDEGDSVDDVNEIGDDGESVDEVSEISDDHSAGDGSAGSDHPRVSGEASSDVELPQTDAVLRSFAALGAQQAFQIDPEILKQFRVPHIDIASMWEAQGVDASKLFSTEVLASLKIPQVSIQRFQLPASFWESIDLTTRLLRDSVSIDSLYSTAQLALAASARPNTRPRSSRTPEMFFGEHEVEIDSVRALLRALTAVQTKHHQHRPVWRGHQDAGFEVHSSLYRRLAKTSDVSEARLVSAEIETLSAARRWGIRARRPLEFFAKLQHNGAPTRLLDATVDPEIATWFAVEADPALDEVDGMVIGWGRVPRTTPMSSGQEDSIPESRDVPFWHAWTTDDERHRVDWGTGTKTWTWFPPALSERMRAQRAGFLLEAGPILTDDVVSVFSDALSQDWRASEIARATSIVGLPSRHDVLTKPNAANLVPIFALRILKTAKRPIREYLERKGLTYSTGREERIGDN